MFATVNESAHQTPHRKRRQVIYAILPFFLLLLCLTGLNLVGQWSAEATSLAGESGGEITAVATPPSLTSSNLPATPSPTAPPPTTTPAPTPTPTLPPDAIIQLLGPPDGSVLNSGTPLSLYWNWPYSLDEGQIFVVYLGANGQETRVGALSEANMGQGYHWLIPPDELTVLGAEGVWQVRLEATPAGTVLLRSEQRSFRLLPSP